MKDPLPEIGQQLPINFYEKDTRDDQPVAQWEKELQNLKKRKVDKASGSR